MSLINISNHVSGNWSDKQFKAALQYGDIIDYPFPNVSPDFTEEEIDKLGDKVVEDVVALKPKAVMCQGEFTLCFNIVRKLAERGITVVAGCTERKAMEVRENDAVKKTTIFEFVGFRKYI